MDGGQSRRRGRKVSEILAREMLDAIARQRLEPGTMLPAEAEMIRIYGVGRATLREALRLLEAHGVIRMKTGPGGGPQVASLTPHDFAEVSKLHLRLAGATFGEVLQARLAIEPVLARLAAEHRDEAGLEELRAVLDSADATNLDDDVAYAQLSREFHSVVARISGNRVLDLLGESLKDVYDTKVRAAVMPKRRRSGVREVHREIGRAIIDGRATDAEHLMREHLVKFADVWRKQNPQVYEDLVLWD